MEKHGGTANQRVGGSIEMTYHTSDSAGLGPGTYIGYFAMRVLSVALTACRSGYPTCWESSP
jgi:hypothetical protein